jgi:hypothetical protein
MNVTQITEGGGRSVGIIFLRTKVAEFRFSFSLQERSELFLSLSLLPGESLKSIADSIITRQRKNGMKTPNSYWTKLWEIDTTPEYSPQKSFRCLEQEVGVFEFISASLIYLQRRENWKHVERLLQSGWFLFVICLVRNRLADSVSSLNPSGATKLEEHYTLGLRGSGTCKKL